MATNYNSLKMDVFKIHAITSGNLNTCYLVSTEVSDLWPVDDVTIHAESL